MTPLITKQQIGKYMTLTENISDLDVNEFINDAQEFDTINVFPEALLEAIATQVKSKIQQWNKDKTYAIGSKVWFNGDEGKYYTALISNTNSQPTSENTNWEAFELMNFYDAYLVPFMAYSFQYRFTAYHGIKTAQAGMIQTTDPNGTFEPISDAARGRKLGDVKNKVNVWTGKISKKLNDVNFTFDGVRYAPESGKSTRIKQGVRIYALGVDRCRKRRDCDGFNNEIIDL